MRKSWRARTASGETAWTYVHDFQACSKPVREAASVCDYIHTGVVSFFLSRSSYDTSSVVAHRKQGIQNRTATFYFRPLHGPYVRLKTRLRRASHARLVGNIWMCYAQLYRIHERKSERRTIQRSRKIRVKCLALFIAFIFQRIFLPRREDVLHN